MRAWIPDDIWDIKVPNCCGILDIGNFHTNDDPEINWSDKDEYPKIKDIPTHGCGIFISTFLPSQRTAMREVQRHHTLLFKTGPHINKYEGASTEGKTKGVYLCVFKYGKETAK